MTEAGDAGNDLFGISLAGRVDLDGDGRVDLAVGASGRDAGGFTDAGAAYLYSGALLRLPPVPSSAFAVEGLTGGKLLARAPDPYALSLTFVYRGDLSALSRVEFSLADPSLPRPFVSLGLPERGLSRSLAKRRAFCSSAGLTPFLLRAAQAFLPNAGPCHFRLGISRREPRHHRVEREGLERR